LRKYEDYGNESNPWEIISNVSESLLSDILGEVLEEYIDEEMIQTLLKSELLSIS